MVSCNVPLTEGAGGVCGVMRIECIETLERFMEIERPWRELFRLDPDATIYLSPDFFDPIVKRVPDRYRILVAWSDQGDCVGILPLHIQTRWSKPHKRLYNELHMLGRVFDADYTGILCHPDHESDVVAGFANNIKEMSFARLVFGYSRDPQPRLGALAAAFSSVGFTPQFHEKKINDGGTDNLICPYIDLPETFDEYLATLSASARQKIRRLFRQLDSDPSLRITRSRPETYETDASILAELWYRKHASRKGDRRAGRLAAQCRELLIAGLANGVVCVTVLWRGKTPVAAQANYIDPVKRHSLFHVSGRDDSVQDIPIGLMLQAHSIRSAIAQGMKVYDFTLGDEAYKLSFGAKTREISYLTISSNTGLNSHGRLDEKSRLDVEARIRRYAAKGRQDDARTAARQALDVWPDLEAAVAVEDLINSAGGSIS
ncbi:MAG: GNAT family N-acetyltransferase [Pseudomonadota bacterium]